MHNFKVSVGIRGFHWNSALGTGKVPISVSDVEQPSESRTETAASTVVDI